MPLSNCEQLHCFYRNRKALRSAYEITSLTKWKDTAPLVEESKVEFI